MLTRLWRCESTWWGSTDSVVTLQLAHNTCWSLTTSAQLDIEPRNREEDSRATRLGREKAGFIALRICLCSSPVTVRRPYPVTSPRIFFIKPGFNRDESSVKSIHLKNRRTRGYSSQSLTRTWRSASGLKNNMRSVPKAPTIRIVGPYWRTHFFSFVPTSLRMILGDWPKIMLPKGGPGTFLRGERKCGQIQTL